MADKIRETIIEFMARRIARGVLHRAHLRRNFKQFRSPHPTVSPRSGLQTVELPLEDYEAIAARATELLKEAGEDITVKYDATDAIRAFVAKLR